MLMVRDVFRTKPGMAKQLVNKFKQVSPFMKEAGVKDLKVMTDVVAGYWTVVIQSEVDNLATFEKWEGFTSKPEVKEIMKGYMELVETGYREIFKIE